MWLHGFANGKSVENFPETIIFKEAKEIDFNVLGL